MSLPPDWRGWDIPWALSLVPKGLTPVPEGFAPFLHLGYAQGTSASWRGLEILQRFSSSLIFYPPLEHPCGCPHVSSCSGARASPLKSLCIVGFTQPKKIQSIPPKLSSPCSQSRYFCSQLPVEIWDGEALPAAPAAPGPCDNGNWMLWGSGVGFGGALKHLGVI